MNCTAVQEAEKNMVFAARGSRSGVMRSIPWMTFWPFMRKPILPIRSNGSPLCRTPPYRSFRLSRWRLWVPAGVSWRRSPGTKTRVKFISASLQYSNYAGQADFVVPYEILTASQWVHDFYLKKCRAAMEHYADIGACGISRDAAGVPCPAEPPQCADNQRHALPSGST